MLPVDLVPTYSGIKYTTPIAKVEIAQSPLTVRSLGLDISYYVFSADAPQWGNPDQLSFPSDDDIVAVCPLVCQYYYEGQPPTVPALDINSGLKWGAWLRGKFMDPISTGAGPQTYTFYAAGDGKITITLSGLIILDQIVNESNQTFVSGAVTLLPGQWHDLDIRYYQRTAKRSGYAVLWKSAEMIEPIPVSAGCTALPTDTTSSGQMPIPWQPIRSVKSIKLDESVGQATQAVIEIPLSGNDDQIGYLLDQANSKLTNIQDEIVGNTNPASMDSANYNTKFASKFTPSLDGTLKSFQVYFKATGTATRRLRAAIYADDNGAPGEKISGATGVVDVTDTEAAWRTFKFSNLSLFAGQTYWFAVHSTAYGSFYYALGSANGGAYNAQSVGWDIVDGLSDPFGAATMNNRAYAIKVDYLPLEIKKGYLIRVSLGYYFDGVRHFVEKFVGNIDNFNVSRDSDIISITANDFMAQCFGEPSINYPTLDDYWATGQIGDESPTGGTHWKTQAFDGWRLDHAFKSLCIRANIDPTLLVRRRQFFDFLKAVVEGGYLIEPANPGGPDIMPLRLERSVRYGNPTSDIPNERDDDYTYKFSFGTSVGDIINNIAGNFGYSWGFNGFYGGAPYLSAANNPSYFLDESYWTSGGYSDKISYSAMGGKYREIPSGYNSFVAATGTRFDLVFMVGSGLGSSDPSDYNIFWQVKRMRDQVVVATGLLNTFHSDPIRGYYDGVDNSLGYNPCVKTIVSGLPYEQYSITVVPTGTLAVFALDGLFSFGRDTSTPDLVFVSADTLDREGNIKELQTQDSIDNLKNDVIVIGKPKIKYSPGSNVDGSYVQSRAVDLEGIYLPSSNRFLGRTNKMLIIDDNIATEPRADYIAYEGLLRTCQAAQSVGLAGLGNPLVELNDAIIVRDPVKNIVNSGLPKWVKAVNSTFDESGYTQQYEIESIEPWPSYQPKPPIPLASFGGHTVIDLQIINGGFITPLRGGLYSSDTALTISGLIPESKIFFVRRDYPTPKEPYHLVRIGDEYIAVTGYNYHPLGADYTELLFAPRGNIRGTSKVDHLPPAEVIYAYDPYYSGNEYNNTRILISYFLVRAAWVAVEISSQERQILVANLTRPDLTDSSGDYRFQKYVYQDAGWHTLEWDGTDQFGTWNSTDLTEPIGYFWKWNNNNYVLTTYSGGLGRGDLVTEKPAATWTGKPYATFFVNIEARDPQTGNLLESVASTNLDPTYNSQAYPIASNTYGNLIHTLRGPIFSMSFGINPPFIQDNNESGAAYFTGAENDGLGLKITASSIWPNPGDQWDPPRYLKYQFGFTMRHKIAVRYDSHQWAEVDYDGNPLYGWWHFRWCYINIWDENIPNKWGHLDMDPVDMASGFNFYFQPTEDFTYGDTAHAYVPQSGPYWTISTYSGYWHAWAFALGGQHNGEFRDRSGRFRELYPIFGMWNADGASGVWRRNDLVRNSGDDAHAPGVGEPYWAYFEAEDCWLPYQPDDEGHWIWKDFQGRPNILRAWYERIP